MPTRCPSVTPLFAPTPLSDSRGGWAGGLILDDDTQMRLRASIAPFCSLQCGRGVGGSARVESHLSCGWHFKASWPQVLVVVQYCGSTVVQLLLGLERVGSAGGRRRGPAYEGHYRRERFGMQEVLTKCWSGVMDFTLRLRKAPQKQRNEARKRTFRRCHSLLDIAIHSYCRREIRGGRATVRVLAGVVSALPGRRAHGAAAAAPAESVRGGMG